MKNLIELLSPQEISELGIKTKFVAGEAEYIVSANLNEEALLAIIAQKHEQIF